VREVHRPERAGVVRERLAVVRRDGDDDRLRPLAEALPLGQAPLGKEVQRRPYRDHAASRGHGGLQLVTPGKSRLDALLIEDSALFGEHGPVEEDARRLAVARGGNRLANQGREQWDEVVVEPLVEYWIPLV